MNTSCRFVFNNLCQHEIAIHSIEEFLKKQLSFNKQVNLNMTLMLANMAILGLYVRAQEKKIKKLEKEITKLKGD